jgi:hypothetical protein
VSRLGASARDIVRIVRQVQTPGSPFTVPKAIATLAGVPEHAPPLAAEPCAHEDVTLECPYCAGRVDADTRVCAACLAGVDPVRVCVHCDEELGTLGEYEDAAARRAHPRHRHVLVEADAGVRCVECGGYGEVITRPGDTWTPADTAPCPACGGGAHA